MHRFEAQTLEEAMYIKGTLFQQAHQASHARDIQGEERNGPLD